MIKSVSSSFSSIPPRRRPLLPQPDNPIDVFRLAAEVFQPCHALATVMLGVHGDLNQRLVDRDLARRIGKPGDADFPGALFRIHAAGEISQCAVAFLGPDLEIRE